MLCLVSVYYILNGIFEFALAVRCSCLVDRLIILYYYCSNNASTPKSLPT